MKQLEAQVLEWSAQRGILEYSSKQAQCLKAVSEVGELSDAVLKADHDAIVDGIGDSIVCLINLAAMQGVDLHECVSRAYDEIKDRKGRLNTHGAWVKEDV